MIALRDNIKRLRKENKLTQEALAEVLGVTAGAVYKWERGLATPELNIIIALADFFDLSVDALLGYEAQSNNKSAIIKRLEKYTSDKDEAGLTEAEKAVSKYPNSFDVLYKAGKHYFCCGLKNQDKNYYKRALELMQKSLIFIDQSTGTDNNEFKIKSEIAMVHLKLNQADAALKILMENNADHIFSDLIGVIFATEKKNYEEASKNLSESLINLTVKLIRTVTGFVNLYMDKSEYNKTIEIITWLNTLLFGLQKDEQPSYLQKIRYPLFIIMSYCYFRTGQIALAEEHYSMGLKLGESFEKSPDYSITNLKFVDFKEENSFYDDLSENAQATVKELVKGFKDEKFIDFVEGITEYEN
ncbi:MAG: helix-turn-helix transcriptional regulator [Eubacteriales bacterium]|nr:helix-turn-helix transcriptional regulator [Eubacteriales bacterium]